MKTTQVTPYSALPNSTVQAANGINYAYRDTGGREETVPLVLLQHFRGNLDYWDPALVDALAQSHQVITFDNAGTRHRDRRPRKRRVLRGSIAVCGQGPVSRPAGWLRTGRRGHSEVTWRPR